MGKTRGANRQRQRRQSRQTTCPKTKRLEPRQVELSERVKRSISLIEAHDASLVMDVRFGVISSKRNQIACQLGCSFISCDTMKVVVC